MPPGVGPAPFSPKRAEKDSSPENGLEASREASSPSGKSTRPWSGAEALLLKGPGYGPVNADLFRFSREKRNKCSRNRLIGQGESRKVSCRELFRRLRRKSVLEHAFRSTPCPMSLFWPQ